MAVAVHEAQATDVDQVIGSVMEGYASQREVVTEMPLAEFAPTPRSVGALRSVVAVEAHTVEIALDDEADAAALAPVAWDLASRGWATVVLVPLERLGETHGELRGAPCRLQGWWRDESGLSFTRHETP
jgi:hypothetical protein